MKTLAALILFATPAAAQTAISPQRNEGLLIGQIYFEISINGQSPTSPSAPMSRYSSTAYLAEFDGPELLSLELDPQRPWHFTPSGFRRRQTLGDTSVLLSLVDHGGGLAGSANQPVTIHGQVTHAGSTANGTVEIPLLFDTPITYTAATQLDSRSWLVSGAEGPWLHPNAVLWSGVLAGDPITVKLERIGWPRRDLPFAVPEPTAWILALTLAIAVAAVPSFRQNTRIA